MAETEIVLMVKGTNSFDSLTHSNAIIQSNSSPESALPSLYLEVAVVAVIKEGGRWAKPAQLQSDWVLIVPEHLPKFLLMRLAHFLVAMRDSQT